MPNYIEKSIQHVATLNPDEVASHSLGSLIGSSYSRLSGFSTYSLYRANDLDLGIKVPGPLSRGDEVKFRVAGELSTAAFLIEHAPKLEPLLPAFLGIVATRIGGGVEPLAVITEDASQGNCLGVWSRSTSQETTDAIAKGFAHFGPFNDIFDEKELRDTMSFDVGGHERLLDLTPPPFSQKYYLRLPGYREAYRQAWDRAEGWTIDVAPDSPLAESVTGLH